VRGESNSAQALGVAVRGTRVRAGGRAQPDDHDDHGAVRRSRRRPLYHQILEELRRDILEGRLRPGDQVATEPELIARFEVSRTTVRLALGELVHEGLLYRRSGKGTFVTQPKLVQQLTALTGFVEDMVAQRMEASARVVGIERVAADATVARHLNVPPDGTVVRLERVRLGNQEPLSFDVTFLPPALGERVIREDLAIHPIFELMEDKYGIPVGYADYRIHAATADRTVAQYLEVARGAPILLIERVSYSPTGTPFLSERLYYRGDRVSYHTRLQRRPDQGPPTPRAADSTY
jgi:GntR family transcriptional regulator